VQFIRNTIEALLKEDTDPFPSLQELARRFGCYVGTLQEHCPDLCQAVMARFRQCWPDDVHERVKQALLKELASDQPKPLAKVARELNCGIETLRYHFPDLCRAIFTRYYQRIDYEQIRQRLQEMLASTGTILSVAEFARQEGGTPSVLKARFPNQCKQMVTLRRIAKRRRRDGRIADGCQEVGKHSLAESAKPWVKRQ
jgi:AraC-like DNA-binding protein